MFKTYLTIALSAAALATTSLVGTADAHPSHGGGLCPQMRVTSYAGYAWLKSHPSLKSKTLGHAMNGEPLMVIPNRYGNPVNSRGWVLVKRWNGHRYWAHRSVMSCASPSELNHVSSTPYIPSSEPVFNLPSEQEYTETPPNSPAPVVTKTPRFQPGDRVCTMGKHNYCGIVQQVTGKRLQVEISETNFPTLGKFSGECAGNKTILHYKASYYNPAKDAVPGDKVWVPENCFNKR